MSGSGSGKAYVPAYPPGDPRMLHSKARANISSGELMVKWFSKTQDALNRYKGEHGRAGSSATGTRASAATLDALAKIVFSNYIRYAIAQDKHGVAAAEAPRKANEFSQVAEEVEENVPGYFGTSIGKSKKISTKIVRGGLSVSEEREINAIVREEPELAAKYGLEEGTNNLGPKVIVDTAKAKIAEEGGENLGSFAGGRRRKTRKGRKHRKHRKPTRKH